MTITYSTRNNVKFLSLLRCFPQELIPDPFNLSQVRTCRGNAVAQWLRCCATNWKVAGSIPAGVIGFFILPIALWSWGRLSLLQKWVPEEFPGGKGGRCLRLTTYHHPVPLSLNLGTLTSWYPLSHSGPVTGLLYLYLYILVEAAWRHHPAETGSNTFADSVQHKLPLSNGYT